MAKNTKEKVMKGGRAVSRNIAFNARGINCFNFINC